MAFNSQFGATFGNSKGFGKTANFNDSFDVESRASGDIDFGFNNDLNDDLGYKKNNLNQRLGATSGGATTTKAKQDVNNRR